MVYGSKYIFPPHLIKSHGDFPQSLFLSLVQSLNLLCWHFTMQKLSLTEAQTSACFSVFDALYSISCPPLTLEKLPVRSTDGWQTKQLSEHSPLKFLWLSQIVVIRRVTVHLSSPSVLSSKKLTEEKQCFHGYIKQGQVPCFCRKLSPTSKSISFLCYWESGNWKMALFGKVRFKGKYNRPHEMKLKSIRDCALHCESLGISTYCGF